jgi:thymidylate synthase
MNKEHLHPDGRPYTQEEFVEKIKTDKSFSKRFGNLGKIYGYQWRNWNGEIDQISELIRLLKETPDSRRMVVNAWAVHDLTNMVLPPCHYGFQVYTRELSDEERLSWMKNNKSNVVLPTRDPSIEFSMDEWFRPYGVPKRAISLMWNQRSVDTFLGLPFNIASYGLLLEIIAKEVNMVPDELIGNLGDTHLYLNHIDQAKEQIGRRYTHEERLEELKKAMGDFYQTAVDEQVPFGGGLSEYFSRYGIRPNLHTREPYPLPKLLFKDHLDQFDSIIDILRPIDFVLDNYQSHPTIKAPLSN